MNRFFIMICTICLLPTLSEGQEVDYRTAGRGYGFAAPGIIVGDGSTMSFIHFGAGAEANLYKGLGFGAEIGYLAPIHHMDEGVGLFSVNGLYNFEKPGAQVVPFVTAGYSLLFRSGHLNALNFGGGVDCWLWKKVGMRFEVRDHISTEYFGNQLLQGRIGIVFH